eukprot:8592051-Lingulodinium_polyedra.AAC.1
MASPSQRGQRRVLYGYAESAGSADALKIALAAQAIREKVQILRRVVAGHASVLRDPGAIVVDYTNP